MKQFTRTLVAGLAGLMACSALSGCVMMGYSSGSGFFIWPGSIGLLLILALLWFFLRSR